MSILPAVTVPPDYVMPSGPSPTWAIGQSRKAVKMMDAPSEADDALKLVGIGAHTFAYIQGNSSTPPLEADRFTQIKSDLTSMTAEGFKPVIAIRIIAQTVSIIQSYTSLYNLLAANPISPILPYDKELAPLASFVLKGDGLLDDIESWQEAQGTDQETASFIKMMGSTASTLLYAAQVVAFLAMTKVNIGLQVTLSTILYATSIYDIILSENDAAASYKKEVETPPEISMMV